MCCTGVPHSGQGSRYRPWTAIPFRKAVTFSGNPSAASARSLAVQSSSTLRVAEYSRSTSASVSFWESATGESFAAWRISSE